MAQSHHLLALEVKLCRQTRGRASVRRILHETRDLRHLRRHAACDWESGIGTDQTRLPTPYHTRLDPPPAHGWTPPEITLKVVTGKQSAGMKEVTAAHPGLSPGMMTRRSWNGTVVRHRRTRECTVRDVRQERRCDTGNRLSRSTGYTLRCPWTRRQVPSC